MKATQLQQQALLDLATLDLEISRTRRRLDALRTNTASDSAHATLVELSSKLIEARHQDDELAGQVERLDQDLQMVLQRIERDLKHVDQSSNSKDIQGMQHELDSLRKRQAALEDQELELLSSRESVAVVLADLTAARGAAQAELDKLEAANEAEVAKLQSGLSLLDEQRTRLEAHLSDEQQSAYQKLLGKTVPVARLEGLACGACNLTLSGASIDQIRSTPGDELARCPECSAMLVRI